MDNDDYRIRDYVLIIIVIILLILCILTSFQTGQKFFELRHSGFGDSKSNIDSNVANFYFDAQLILDANTLEREVKYEKYNY